MQFQYQQFIGLLIAFPVFVLLFFALLRWKKRAINRIGEEKLVKALISNHSSRLFSIKFILILLAFVFGVLAVMNPRKPGSSENISRKGIDLVIAMDVSKSMLATDIQPTRLENARLLINKLIDDLPNDRIGLVLFAGKAYLQMPLTIDHEAAKMFVSTASPESVPQQGTVISDALIMCSNALKSTEQRFKTVVLISDGEDHGEDNEKTAKELSRQGIMVNTVGIGSPEGSTIMDPVTGEIKKDQAGNTVISKLNEDELKRIAAETNGIYDHLENPDATTNTLLTQLSGIEKKAFIDTAFLDYTTFYMWLAAAMFILLFAEIFIPERKPAII
ncbi:MAG TPA: VWA domain-containing protein [Chitinophagaceae bacterium]|nr:VWA domain-containing protein [Chitinophagaceae bacterium]